MLSKLFLICIPALLLATTFSPACATAGVIDFDFGDASQFAFTPALPTNRMVNGASSGANAGPVTVGFDKFNAATLTAGSDGIDDVFVTFQLVNSYDVYGSSIIDAHRGATHGIQVPPQTGVSGLRGTTPVNDTSANETSTGDVAGYQIKVTLGQGLFLDAADFEVDGTSWNTAGSAFESSSLVFLDAQQSAYGTASYTGYFDSAPSGAGGSGDGTVASSAWMVMGTGVYIAAANKIDLTDPLNPTSNGVSESAYSINASLNAGLTANDSVAGFVFTSLLEDVANTATEGARTETGTTITSTLSGFRVDDASLSSVPEPSHAAFLILLAGSGMLRRLSRPT